MTTSVDLPEYFIETFSTMMVLHTMGYSYEDVKPMVCDNAIFFNIKMGDGCSNLMIAKLSAKVVGDSIMRNWASAMETWNGLSSDERGMLVARSGAVDRLSVFFLVHGNAPALPEAQAPIDLSCPWCKRPLRCEGGALLRDLKVSHSQPACPEFEAAGPAVALKAVGDRIRHQMLTMGQGREYSGDDPKIV